MNHYFYDERLSAPLNSFNVKRFYGIDPVADAATAAKIGVYPLTLPPSGYSARTYQKEGNTYVAVPRIASDAQIRAVVRANAVGLTLIDLVDAAIVSWSASTTYSADDIVKHNNSVWKAKQTNTDEEPGTWSPVLPSDVDPNWTFIN